MVTNITIFFGNEKKMINIFCYLSANYLAFFIFLVRNYGNYGWKDFVAGLDKQGVATRFKTKGNTDVVQGIIFEKDGCSFSGSKIDRSCSFSRIHAEIARNIRQAQQHLSKEPMAYSTDESGFASDLSDALSEVFTMPMPSGGVDVDELRFQKKLRNRANRKRRI